MDFPQWPDAVADLGQDVKPKLQGVDLSRPGRDPYPTPQPLLGEVGQVDLARRRVDPASPRLAGFHRRQPSGRVSLGAEADWGGHPPPTGQAVPSLPPS